MLVVMRLLAPCSHLAGGENQLGPLGPSTAVAAAWGQLGVLGRVRGRAGAAAV